MGEGKVEEEGGKEKKERRGKKREGERKGVEKYGNCRLHLTHNFILLSTQ